MDTSEIDAFLSQNFTHIVIGGGTAGLVVANRLSEDPSICVGVLEAGIAAFDDPRITVPGRFGENIGSEHDWKFETTKQPGLDGRSLPFPRGKVLGGTSALNFMTWNRGNKEDYDAWEKLGNKGWGWKGILPFWKKAEHFTEPTLDLQKEHSQIYDPSFHGQGGPLHTTYSATYGASHQHWHKTLNRLGVQTNASHFSGSNVGCWTTLSGVTADKRERCYSASAYYQPVADRPNLIILTSALVEEVLFEQEGRKLITKGVRFSRDGREYKVRTSGEVIVCGGSVSSPQILELSGIGHPRILEASGIECKVESPNVGENFQEHMMTAMVVELDPSVEFTNDDLKADPLLSAAADKQYLLERAGPRANLPGSVAYLPFSQIIPADKLKAWSQTVSSTKSSSPSSLRDRILAERLTDDTKLGQIEFYFDLSMYNPYFETEPGKKYGTMLMMLQYPFSKGSMHIPPKPQGKPRTTAEDKPLIDPKYYQGPGGNIDFQAMALCQRFADKITRTEPLSSIIVQRSFPPERSDGQAAQEEDFSDWVRANTITDWHPVGTCAMGGDEGIKAGVVDERLKVYGVEGLRVVDASIMPLQIAAHLQATVYAIGEKGAEMIKEDWVRGRGRVNGVERNGVNGTNGVHGLNGVNGTAK